jgi:ribonuclease P protein component
MLAKKHRFHGYNSLRAVYQKGQAARVAGITMRVLPNPRRSTYRAAVVVSKKVHKSAVVRNRIRRRVYEQLRLLVPESCRADIVVLVYTEDVASVESLKLAGDLKRVLGQLGCYENLES